MARTATAPRPSAGASGETAQSPPAAPVRIFAVVVLYRQDAGRSPALRTLLHSASLCLPDAFDLRVLLYDNGPLADIPPPELADGVSYLAAPANGGLAAAYNAALERALAGGFEWLLTLDYDTELPPSYFQSLLAAAHAVADRQEIAAVVPYLLEQGRILSPSRIRLGTTEPLAPASDPLPPGELRAYNSAALLRVSHLRDLGGFSSDFWLDYLDCWLHHQFHRRGKRLYVIPHLTVAHQLSLLNYRERLTPFRFRNFLQAESAWHDLYSGPLDRLLYTARLAVRLVLQKRRGESPEILLATRQLLRSRLTRRRQYRLRLWRDQTRSLLRTSHGPEA
jgi:GT2 family glycosyltransferase